MNVPVVWSPSRAVRIGSQRVFLDLQRLLGEGGEAVVLGHCAEGTDLAVKLYKHPNES